MRVLVTGAAGQLGQDVCSRLTEEGMLCRGVDRQDFDITDAQATRKAILDWTPDVVIHCAAYTNVEKAEEEPDLCHAVNAQGTRNIARAAQDVGAKLIAISTDYVLSGQGDTPLATDAPYAPQSVYGKSKMLGEIAAAEECDRLFLVRTAWVFGLQGRNFVKTMLSLGAQKEEVRVVGDQFGSPTYTPDLARLLCAMCRSTRYGTYHATNEGFTSWAEFAQEIFAQAQLPCRVVPISSDAYPSKAKRPFNSRLSKACLDAAGLERLPPWQDALARFLAQMRLQGLFPQA